jgi:16S rRNA U1498 N3-methylase RsmE
VAVAACEQCGRNRVPEVSLPVDLPDALSDSRSAATAGLKLLLAAATDQGTLPGLLADFPPAAGSSVVLLERAGGRGL